jgi:phage portal protein
METMFNRSLLLEKEKKEGYFFKINTDDVLKSTQEERFSALQTGINAGILSLNEARIKENMPPIPDDFIKLSLGSVMYYPDKGTLFVPNMSTTFDATTNKIIDSPQMVKNGDNRIEGDETPKTEQKTEEIDTKQAEKTQKDEKGDKK